MNTIEEIHYFELEPINNYDSDEYNSYVKASKLLEAGFPDHSLNELWNLAVHNLRRRIESFSVDLFLNAAQDRNPGKKINYKQEGFSISERWCGIEDSILIDAAFDIDLINGKTRKVLESINWMRNHASAAHENSEEIKVEDVVAFASLIKANLLELPNPNKINSPTQLMDDIKKESCSKEKLSLIANDVLKLPSKSFNMFVGFLINMICSGDETSYLNSFYLFPIIWKKVPESKRQEIGNKFQSLVYENVGKSSVNKIPQERLFELLLSLDAFDYVPEVIRTLIFNKYADNLAKAKNSTYGWSNEEAAAKALRQLGTNVPDDSFNKVYPEILAVYCGNRWGRSNAYLLLNDFIFTKGSKSMIKIAKLFVTNNRANGEMYIPKPKAHAIELLNEMKKQLTIIAQQNEIDAIINEIKEF